MKHKCPIPGCATRVNSGLLMCGHHWGLVPRPIQREVWSTWRALSTENSVENIDAYKTARDRAIKSVEEVAQC